MTIDELNALPAGTRLRDSETHGALWVKHPDDTWHLIEQEDGWAIPGYDWSGADGDTSANVLFGRGILTVV